VALMLLLWGTYLCACARKKVVDENMASSGRVLVGAVENSLPGFRSVAPHP
jgi:hypothetical protein